MYSKRQRKHKNYKETSSNEFESEYIETTFKESTSKFNHVEEKNLRMKIVGKEEITDIIDIQDVTDIPQSVKDFYLEDMSSDEIKIYNPKKYPNFNETVSSFLIKLKLVLENNAQANDVSREERFIDDMAIELMKAVKYDDGKNFTMRPCSLKLVVGSGSYAAEADREGRRGMEIIWVMQENKHIEDTRYEEGDIQLISCMIAACQANYRRLKEVYPEKMKGIKIKGDQVFFYSLKMTEQYLKDLTKYEQQTDLKTDLEIFKFPSKIGLSISNPKERKELLGYLWAMRKDAMIKKE